mmetsp:Transcript_2797/g.6058  ORF Transcript_2797/g.6058 Transcript_2797/m.6058 type:complete len:242 (+) Transcript_2797:505-1230(+)
MPTPILLYHLTIITLDRDHLGQFRRHRLQSNPHGHSIPRGFHPLMRLCRLFANRTPRIMTRQLTKAMPVNGVAAWQFVGGVSARKEVFVTDGAVGHVLPDFAIVMVEKLFVDAHSAVLTVTEIFSTADAAEAAVGAVVGALFIGHPEVADGTVVFAELDVAVDAVVSFATLLSKALPTDNLPNRKPINIVMLRRPRRRRKRRGHTRSSQHALILPPSAPFSSAPFHGTFHHFPPICLKHRG